MRENFKHSNFYLAKAQPQQHTAPPSERDHELLLSDLIMMFWRHRLLLAVAVGLIMVVSSAIIFTLKPQYTASALVKINPSELRIVNIQSVSPSLMGNDTQLAMSIASEIQVIRSPSLLEEVVAGVGLDHLEEMDPVAFGPREGAQRWLTAGWNMVSAHLPAAFNSNSQEADPAILADQRKDRILKSVSDNLSVSQVERSLVLRISFSSQDRGLAARVANGFAEGYIRSQLQAKASATELATRELRENVTHLQADLEQAEQAVESLRGRMAIDGLNVTSVNQQITALNAEVITARADYENVRARQDNLDTLVRTRGQMAALSTIRSDLVGPLLLQKANLMQSAAQLLQQYGASHPSFTALQAQIRAMDNQITGIVDTEIQNVHNQVKIAHEKLEALENSIAQRNEMLLRLSTAQVELRSLELRADTKRRLLEIFLSRLQEIERIQPVPDASILSAAAVPSRPSFPKKTLLLSVSLLGALLMGSAAVFIAEHLNPQLRNAKDVETEMRVPVLAEIPKIKAGLVHGVSAADYVLYNPGSVYTEAIRILFAILMQRKGRLDLNGTIMFTSALPQEGKTTLVSSLARVIERSRISVVVIDCDIRSPKIHLQFGLPNTIGLTSYICNGERLDEVVLTDPKSGLAVIPAGPPVEEPYEIIASNRLRQMLQELSEQYELVLIDGAPILSVSDIRILAPQVGQCVLVAKSGAIKQANMQRSLAVLEDCCAPVSGIVLNEVEVKRYDEFYGSRSRIDHRSAKRAYDA